MKIDFNRAWHQPGKCFARLYGKVIKSSSAKELGIFIKVNIKHSANIKTDETLTIKKESKWSKTKEHELNPL